MDEPQPCPAESKGPDGGAASDEWWLLLADCGGCLLQWRHPPLSQHHDTSAAPGEDAVGASSNGDGQSVSADRLGNVIAACVHLSEEIGEGLPQLAAFSTQGSAGDALPCVERAVRKLTVLGYEVHVCQQEGYYVALARPSPPLPTEDRQACCGPCIAHLQCIAAAVRVEAALGERLRYLSGRVAAQREQELLHYTPRTMLALDENMATNITSGDSLKPAEHVQIVDCLRKSSSRLLQEEIATAIRPFDTRRPDLHQLAIAEGPRLLLLLELSEGDPCAATNHAADGWQAADPPLAEAALSCIRQDGPNKTAGTPQAARRDRGLIVWHTAIPCSAMHVFLSTKQDADRVEGNDAPALPSVAEDVDSSDREGQDVAGGRNDVAEVLCAVSGGLQRCLGLMSREEGGGGLGFGVPVRKEDDFQLHVETPRPIG
ncbi:unnamed protein product [Vitrella brassicaformis CCMP3155]|uniref:Uncharacterized protein n=1 Tax=Vitrella brassicaformis (strain CCMP3155) TaxID=1169540 RepID=A0A0G4FEV3_VITBC|nr:unnamed protein product [Vitrella brassicaformis CCMP3155]|eukprot:CEM11735.1 unnamed protein product [Vitrella brassicaformis CCMP3155]